MAEPVSCTEVNCFLQIERSLKFMVFVFLKRMNWSSWQGMKMLVCQFTKSGTPI